MLEAYRRSILDEEEIRIMAKEVATQIRHKPNYGVGETKGWFLTSREHRTWCGIVDNHMKGFTEQSYKRCVYFLSTSGELLYSCETSRQRVEVGNKSEKKVVPKTVKVYHMSGEDMLIFDAPKIVVKDKDGNYDDFSVDYDHPLYHAKGAGLKAALNELIGKVDDKKPTYYFEGDQINVVEGDNFGNVGGHDNTVIWRDR